MRLTSVSAVGRDVGRLAEQAASQVLTKLGGRPDALLWLTDAASRPEEIAAAMADCCGASVGAVSREGLIGGGGEHSASPEESRVVALALSSLHDKCLARPFHSPPDGLPDLPTESWAAFAAASPADSPHLLLLASPPRDGAFAIERWLGRMDAALPWAKKIGGLTVGDGRLFVGDTQHNGGAVGLALSGVAMDAFVCQGALPIGPSLPITASEANIIRALDGREVGEALESVLTAFQSNPTGSLMAGVSVPSRPAAAAPADAAPLAPYVSSPYVVRNILGYSQPHSALIVGASPELLELPDARLQLHVFSADAARHELRAAAAALAELRAETGAADAPSAGGLMVPCLGRGSALYGEVGVESAALAAALGPLELAGFFAGGEIGPVGSRTFVHTHSTAVGLLRG